MKLRWKFKLSAAVLALTCTALAAAAPAAAAAAAEDAPLQLYYYERPPFHYTDESGHATGQFVERTALILHRAGLRFEWVRMPANRILATLRSVATPACSPGWYSTPERRADFWLSKAMLHDKPLIALLRADFAVPPGVTATAFFQMPSMRLLLKQNFSQGSYMNALIERMPDSQVQRVAAEVPAMVQMLKANRADAIITTEVEAALFVREAGFSMSEFQMVHFPDTPDNEYRYIVCSQSIPTRIRTRIDDAIVSQRSDAIHFEQRARK